MQHIGMDCDKSPSEGEFARRKAQLCLDHERVIPAKPCGMSEGASMNGIAVLEASAV